VKSDHLFLGELPPGLFEAVEEYGFEALLERECRPGSFFGVDVQRSANNE
jgi:hypothetical protein